MKSSPITQAEVEDYMSFKLDESSELYQRISEAIEQDPQGQVAMWCKEHRRQTRAQIDQSLSLASEFYGTNE